MFSRPTMAGLEPIPRSLSRSAAHSRTWSCCAPTATMVDKAPDAFPDQMMLGWKREHANKLSGLFGAVTYDNRAATRRAVEPLLAQNYAIFDL